MLSTLLDRFGAALFAVLSLVGLAFLSCTPAPPADFQGSWAWSDDTAYFGLDLETDGTQVTGHHDGGLADGSRIDASLVGEEPSVSGTIEGNVARLRITSTYSLEVSYEATLTVKGDEATWKVTKSMPGQTYIPQEVVLKRQSAPADSGAVGYTPDPAETKLIEEVQALKAGIKSQIQDLGIAPITQDAPGSTEGGEAEIFRKGQALLRIRVIRYGETGKLESNYWFGPAGALVLAERTLSTVNPATGELAGSVDTTSWYYRDEVLSCARDGQENPIFTDTPEINPELEAIAADVSEFRSVGGEQ